MLKGCFIICILSIICMFVILSVKTLGLASGLTSYFPAEKVKTCAEFPEDPCAVALTQIKNIFKRIKILLCFLSVAQCQLCNAVFAVSFHRWKVLHPLSQRLRRPGAEVLEEPHFCVAHLWCWHQWLPVWRGESEVDAWWGTGPGLMCFSVWVGKVLWGALERSQQLSVIAWQDLMFCYKAHFFIPFVRLSFCPPLFGTGSQWPTLLVQFYMLIKIKSKNFSLSLFYSPCYGLCYMSFSLSVHCIWSDSNKC